MAVKVFRSTDTNAPKCGGWAGSLTDVLLGCLVNGYGSVFAAGTITSSGVNVTDGDVVTIDDVTYRFKTVIAAINDVLIGASAAATLTNLVKAINLQGTSGTTYFAGTKTPTGVWASAVSATVVNLSARRGGTSGNSLALTKTAATLTVSGATLSGGSGSDTTTSAGWSNPFNGVGGQRVFKGGSGVQHYYHFDDASPSTAALAKEAQFRGSEAATAFQAATNYFPTVAQIALLAGLCGRKSSTNDQTNRSWIVVADDRTVYVYIAGGDVAGTYMSFAFGEVYSLSAASDIYRSFCIGRAAANDATNAAAVDCYASIAIPNGPSSWAGHYMPRTVAGGGTAVIFWKTSPAVQLGCSTTLATGGQLPPNGPFAGVDPATTAILVAPIYAYESVAVVLRGRMRGLFGTAQGASTFGDGDIVTGAGAYAGRSFLVVKAVNGGGIATGVILHDITGAWETN